MKRAGFVLTVAALAVAASGFYALDRWSALGAARQERASLQERLDKAVRLAREHPRAFGPQAVVPATGDSPLKIIAQETGTRRNVTIGYLSENEREADKGRRERQVIVRLVNPAHPNLVAFLEDLEKVGGARVKEIHVRPSREIPDAYEEAEIVLSRTVRAEGRP